MSKKATKEAEAHIRAATKALGKFNTHRAAALSIIGGGGGYEAARSDRKQTKNWNRPRGSADAVSGGDRAKLRDSGQALVRNNPIAAGIQNTFETEIVGTGLWPRPQLDAEFLGITQDEADRISGEMDRIYSAWAESTAGCYSGVTDERMRQSMVVAARLRDGDILFARRMDKRNGDPFETRVQLIDGGRVCNPRGGSDTRNADGSGRVDGVEFDSRGVHVRYHVANDVPRGMTHAQSWAELPAFGPESGERLARLAFEPDRAGATRGVSLLAPVAELIKQLGTYLDSEVDAAVSTAFFAAMITRPPLLPDEDAPPIMGGVKPVEQEVANREITLEGAVVFEGEAGEDLKLMNPTRPNPSANAFIELFLQLTGMAIGFPYEVLLSHFQSSYSASRAALLRAWHFAAIRRHWLVGQYAAPAREWVLTEAVMKGWLKCPGFLENPFVRAAWCEALWVGDARGSINPLDEARAGVIRMGAQISTLDQEVLEYGGGDGRRNIRQAGRERRLRIEEELVPAELTDTAPASVQP